MSTATLNVGFKHASDCFEWRVDFELELHVNRLGNHGEDRRGEMKG